MLLPPYVFMYMNTLHVVLCMAEALSTKINICQLCKAYKYEIVTEKLYSGKELVMMGS